MSKKLFFYHPGLKTNKYVGNYDINTKIFAKIVDPKSLIEDRKGYAIPEEVIQRLIIEGCEKVWIITLTGTQYQSKLEDWLINPAEMNGNIPQRILALDKMTIPSAEKTIVWE